MKRNLLLLLMVFLTSFGMNAQINSVALVGEATPWGWPPYPTDDPGQLTQVDAENWQIVDVTLSVGNCKLRANNAWGGAGFEWAGPFPTGTGTSAGDIAVTIAGVYTVTLNTTTGVYNFVSSGGPLEVVKLVGSAVTEAGGLTMAPLGGGNYQLQNVTLVDGVGQFDVDGVATGGDTFPTGDGTNPALFIPIPAGTYSTVLFSITDGQYSFTLAPVFPIISLIGSGTTGSDAGWAADLLDLSNTAGVYTAYGVQLYSDNVDSDLPGAVKFRTNNDWAQPSYGGLSFPTGPVAGNNEDIIVTTDGTYDVVFDLATAAYIFNVPTIALVGPAAGGWPGDPGNPGPIDAVQMTTTDNGRTYIIPSVTLLDGDVKLRANNSWDFPNQAWGGITFPSGVADATPGSANIAATAGTYGVTFDRVTGQLTFGAPLATTSFQNANFSVYPNPTHNVWNFTSASENIELITVIDVLGKTVMTVSPKNISAVVDASGLNTGIYFARIATSSSNTTVKLVKN